MAADAFDLTQHPIHLGLGARVVPQEPFDGMEWYQRYGARVADDGVEGRLVTLYEFDAPWDSWEMHPLGEELVLCLEGEITLHQDRGGETSTVTLGPNQAVVNPAGVWHTADVAAAARVLFITAGAGTEHRPR